MSIANEPGALSLPEHRAGLPDSQITPPPSAQAILGGYKRNLDAIAQAAQLRRQSFSDALRRQEQAIQNMLMHGNEAGGDAPGDAVRAVLERRLAALQSFTEINDRSSQEFLEAIHRRAIDWYDETSRWLLGSEYRAVD